MKVRCVNAEGFKSVLREGNIYEGELKFNNTFNEKRWEIRGVRKVEGLAFKEWRFEEVKQLTFQEVIANIKDGEVWVSGAKIIEMVEGRIQVSRKDGKEFDSCLISFSGKVKYRLKYRVGEKEYSFTEAFRAYEEGKEIESIHSGYRYKKVNGVDLYTRGGKEWYEEDDFEIDEIREAWYINE